MNSIPVGLEFHFINGPGLIQTFFWNGLVFPKCNFNFIRVYGFHRESTLNSQSTDRFPMFQRVGDGNPVVSISAKGRSPAMTDPLTRGIKIL